MLRSIVGVSFMLPIVLPVDWLEESFIPLVCPRELLFMLPVERLAALPFISLLRLVLAAVSCDLF